MQSSLINNNKSFHQLNINQIKQSIQSTLNNQLVDFFNYLQQQYPPQSKKINLGSYQIPIQSQGVKLLMKYIYWNIQMINLTMHKIQNQGLQNLIKRNLPPNLSQSQQITQPWTQLLQLYIIKNNLTSQGFNDIQKINLQNLKILGLSNNKINHIAIYKFIQCNWPNLVQLQIASNLIGKQGCRLLMKSKWKNFKRIDLNFNIIENQGVHYLTEADWPQLTQINLSNTKIDSSATFYLKNANWPKLKSLMLNKNLIGKAKQKLTNIGCQNLSNLKTKQLQKLSLYGNQISLNGIKMLLYSNKLAPGCFLQLSRNNFKFEDIKQILTSQNRFCNEFLN